MDNSEHFGSPIFDAKQKLVGKDQPWAATRWELPMTYAWLHDCRPSKPTSKAPSSAEFSGAAQFCQFVL